MENNSIYKPSAPSPTTWAKTAFPPATTILAAFGAVIVAILPAFLCAQWLIAAKILPHHLTLEQSPVRLLLALQAVSYVPLIAYLLAVVPPLSGRSLTDLGVHLPNARQVSIALSGAAVMWVVVVAGSGIITAITHEHQTEAAVQLLRELHTLPDTLAFIAIAVLFAPMVEEFAFRVFLFNALSRYTSTRIAAVVSGVMFGMVHGSGISVILPLSLGGIVLAWIYVRSRCYWSNVITHALFNAAGVVAVLVFHATD